MGGKINNMDTAKETYRWVSFAVFSLIFAGIFAFLVALTRTPFIQILSSSSYFYSSLAGHVIFSIVIWLMTFTVGIWHYSFPFIKKDPITFPLMIAGALLIAISAIFALGEPYLNNYVPVIGSPIFYLGLLMFGIGFFINALKYFPQALGNLVSENNMKQLASVSIMLSVLMMLSLVPSFLRATQEGGMKLYFERAFWIPGHIQQFVNASVMLIGWHFLLGTDGREGANSKWLKLANLFLLFSSLPLLAGLIGDPLSTSIKYIIIVAFGAGIGVPVLVHTGFVLRRFPKKLTEIATLAMLFSIIVYYTGAIIAYGGFQSDLRIPAHYHGVVTAVTLSLMGVTYYIIKQVNGGVAFAKLAKIQPVVYGIGMLFLIVGMYWAGKLGAPRKTYGFEYSQNGHVLTALNVMGFGAVLAVIGGILFVLYAGVSIIKGEKYKQNSDV